MKAYVHTKARRPGGGFDSFLTVEVPIKEKIPHWQAAGLSYTKSGYGARIPTSYMIQYNGRWRRVYCCIYSNICILFIGKQFNECLTVQIDRV